MCVLRYVSLCCCRPQPCQGRHCGVQAPLDQRELVTIFLKWKPLVITRLDGGFSEFYHQVTPCDFAGHLCTCHRHGTLPVQSGSRLCFQGTYLSWARHCPYSSMVKDAVRIITGSIYGILTKTISFFQCDGKLR